MFPRVCVLFALVLASSHAQTMCPAGQYRKCTDLAWQAGYTTCDMFRLDYSYWNKNDRCKYFLGACWACCACSNQCETHPGDCTICSAGKYKAVEGDEVCTSCPPGTWSGEAATACTPCLVGQYSLGGAVLCTTCPAGTGTCGPGSSACDATCTACPADTYEATAGKACGACAVGGTTCTACSSGLKSLAGARACTPTAQEPECPPGQLRLPCEDLSFISTKGFYCSAYKSTRWDKCAEEGACWACCGCAGSWGCPTPKRLGECGNCVAGSYMDVPNAYTSCWKTCLPGTWSGAGATACTACAVGTYSDTYSASSCAACPAGKSTCGAGSTACAAVCVSCEAGKFSAIGTACGPCVAGATTCAACGAGKYSLAGATTCLSCAAGKTTCSEGLSACNNGCNVAGWTGADGSCSCTACAPGKYKATPGTMACTSCPAGTYHHQEPLASFLSARPAYMAASAELYETAAALPGLPDSPWLGAPIGRMTDSSGSGRHGYVYEADPFDSADPFVVPGGVSGHGAGRSIPAVGSFKYAVLWESPVPETFTICSVTRYTASRVQLILEGASNWIHGHDRNGVAGCTYYNGATPGACLGLRPRSDWVVACGRNTNAANSVSTMVNGVNLTFAGGGHGSSWLGINSGLGDDGGLSMSDWQLSRLYVWNVHLSDAEFADASAKLVDYVRLSGFPESSGANCVACPASAPTSAATSPSLASCQRLCPPGTTGALDGIAPCTNCPLGTFKSASGTAACALCPSGKFSSVVGRSACSSCAVGMKSVIKPAGSWYQSGVWYTAAGVPFDFATAYTTEGSTTSMDCVCAEGMYKPPNQYGATGIWGGTCTMCPAGKYRATFNIDWARYVDLGCYDCPVMTFSMDGATSCTRCDQAYWQSGTCGAGNSMAGCTAMKTCNAGYTGPDSYCDACAACAPGSFKAVTGSAACAVCPAGTFPASGATACSACAPGTFSAASGASCTACATGKYVSSSGATVCTNCFVGADSPAGSSALGACKCDPGRYLL